MRNFKTERDLYEHLKPALVTRTKEFRRLGFFYIKKEDIWNYLKESKWEKANNLLMYEIVSDILNVDYVAIDTYLKNKLRDNETNPIIEGM